jgi:hypothetical protein
MNYDRIAEIPHMSTNPTNPVSKMDARERSRILKILESNWQAETQPIVWNH